jgi:hypothetical protein
VATLNATTSCNSHTLWFDTGASHHIVCDEALVHDMCSPSINTVVLGGGEQHSVLGQGNIILKGHSSSYIILAEALFVPSLHLNLCSGVQVTAKGAECWQGGKRLEIRKGTEVLLRGYKEKGMYKIDAQFVFSHGQVAVAQFSSTSAELWHKRFGHLGQEAMRKLASGDMVTGLRPVNDKDQCDVCVKSKQTRVDISSYASARLSTF